MTHTLHRSGNRYSLENDYVIFAIAAQGINAKGSVPKFKRFAEIVLKYDPVNFGDMKTGNIYMISKEEIIENLNESSILHAVFIDKNTVLKCLKDLKEEDLGISIVVSGLIDDVAKCCKAVDLRPHTVEHSLGIHGVTEKLPSRQVLDISTMCGHGMIAFSLIEDLVDKVKKGRKTKSEAAKELAKQCVCGVFNPKRAEEIIQEMI